jgi:hypothetical protein
MTPIFKRHLSFHFFRNTVVFIASSSTIAKHNEYVSRPAKTTEGTAKTLDVRT